MSEAYSPQEDNLDPNLGGAGAPDEDDLSDEAQARAMGWHPLDEFRGDPSQWVDAPEFIRRGENMLPVLRKNNRELRIKQARHDQEIDRLKNTVAEQTEAVKAAVALAKRADERGYQRGLKELRDKQREAVENADTATFDQTQEQIDAMEAERARSAGPEAAPRPPEAEGAKPPPPPVDPAVKLFWEENPWFHADPALRAEMIGAHNTEISLHPQMPVGQQLQRAKARVMKLYPEKFSQTQEDDMTDDAPESPPHVRRPAAGVMRPSGSGAPPRSRSGFDTIADPRERAEAKEAFAKIHKADPTVTEAEYLALYNDPHADVLALRKS